MTLRRIEDLFCSNHLNDIMHNYMQYYESLSDAKVLRVCDEDEFQLLPNLRLTFKQFIELQ